MTTTHLAARLDVLRHQGGFSPATLARFADHLTSADDRALFRMSPLAYAAQAGLDEREAIDLFLHAAHVGLLEFAWGVLCPGCVAFLSTAGGLASVADERRCGFCRITVLGNVDDNVEVAFTVAPAVRRIRFHDVEALDLQREAPILFFSPSVDERSEFHKTLRECLVGATRLGQNEARTLELDLPPGRYVVMAPASHSVLHFAAAADGPTEVDLELLDGQALATATTVRAGRVRLHLHNRTGRAAAALVIADPVPPPEDRVGLCPPSYDLQPFLTGKRLITSEAFRQLFRAESIPAAGGLELKNLTVLFTDLKGSTEMYSHIGDLRAYDLVRQHFELLRHLVARHGGAVVKTIGDAIMASFAEPAPALAAAAAMHREIAGLGGGLQLKIGLHTGPCIAVELNDRLDYFGQTVNLAARVQGLAEAEEIVCTPEVLAASGAAELVREKGLSGRRDVVRLKGIRGEIEVVRLGVGDIG